MSIPHSSMFSSSVSLSSAFPPPNNSLNTSPKFLFIILNCFSNCSFIIFVISWITFFSLLLESSKSNLCSHIKSYLSFVCLYSSIESTLILPKFLISSLRCFTRFVVSATLSGFLYSSATLFGVIS